MGVYTSQPLQFKVKDDGSNPSREQVQTFVRSFGPEYVRYAEKMEIDVENLLAITSQEKAVTYLDTFLDGHSGVDNFIHKYTLLKEWQDWNDIFSHNSLKQMELARNAGVELCPTPYEIRTRKARAIHCMKFMTYKGDMSDALDVMGMEEQCQRFEQTAPTSRLVAPPAPAPSSSFCPMLFG